MFRTNRRSLIQILCCTLHLSAAASLSDAASAQGGMEVIPEAQIRQHEEELATLEQQSSPDDASVLTSLGQLAFDNYENQNWAASYTYATRAAAIVRNRISRAALPTTNRSEGTSRADAELNPTRELDDQLRFFRRIVLAGWEFAQAHPEKATEIRNQAFQAAQLIEQTKAGLASTKLTARTASNDTELSRLLKEREAASGQYVAADEERWRKERAIGNVSTAEIDRIDKNLATIDNAIRNKFPQYYDTSIPRPFSIEQTQAALREGEALLLIYESYELAGIPERSSQFGRGRFHDFMRGSMALERSLNDAAPTEKMFGWVVTKTAAKWIKLKRDRRGVASSVINLRCGLDKSQWITEAPGGRDASSRSRRQVLRSERCRSYYGDARAKGKLSGALPFDAGLAHELYGQLFEPFEADIEGKELLVLTSSIIAELPLHVLLVERPKKDIFDDLDDFRSASWFGARYPITMLPTLASLEQRRSPRSQEKRPFFAVANPLLEGDGSEEEKRLAQDAMRKVKCGQAANKERNSNDRPPSLGLLQRGVGIVSAIKKLRPLPDTSDEACAIAAELNLPQSELLLGDKATERTIKKLSKEGSLRKYQILLFATHGLSVQDSERLDNTKGEPALVLTPPRRAENGDDGLLTASEIAQLDIDADWVILSACNTASGEKESQEVFSGLASAFMSAGARSLLVSHWLADSEASKLLIISLFRELGSNRDIGRAAALKRAMNALITNDNPLASHPMNWAPFVLVGTGDGRALARQ